MEERERERERESERRRRKIERKVFKRVNLSHVLHVHTVMYICTTKTFFSSTLDQILP